MAFALHVELGGAPVAQVHDVIHRIGATSPGSRTVLGLGIGVHVTLIVVDTLSEIAQSKLLDLVGAQPMQSFRFPSWGVFPGAKSVLFLAPVVSNQLLRLHSACCSAVSRKHPIWAHYQPKAWVPHATLTEDIPRDDLPRVVSQLSSLSLPLTLDPLAIVVSEFPPVRRLQGRELRVG